MKLIAYSLFGLVAMLLLIALTGCADYPVTLGVAGNHGTYTYSATQGLGITLDLKSSK